MKELYALDESFRQENAEWMAEFAEEYENGEYYFAPGDYTGLLELGVSISVGMLLLV